MRTFVMACALVAFVGATPAWAESAADQMAQQVADALRDSGQLANYRVGVKYEDGVAWLLGSVTSPAQAEAAAQIAQSIEGIDHVVNKLEVTPPAPQVADDAGLQLAAMEEQAAAPAPLPPNPQAMPAPINRGMPRPIQRVAQMPQGQQGQMPIQSACYGGVNGGGMGTPQGYSTGGSGGASYDQANMPGYAWPSYAAHPNYAALSYPKQYSASAWPYIGPFYPYPQVPLGWRKVTLEWDDGWWFMDFSHHKGH
ncbi:BON domain-containing protein [Botrimarina hoheduenensis]|uniref:Periplasmic protein n=1 Tax=Botrimarina hoheduenensis TaxID=2528000 RepID=A0A5C5WAI4_9BACT|nr:BON domain-containing protein [Botrimarina hoheduenensis]TWT47175.1 periplasmic protein [Botrimarina hoheduenensis]